MTVDRRLSRRRILVARPPERSGPLRQRLERLGATVVCRPAIAVEPVALSTDDRALLESIGSGDLLVFTSVNGVAHYLRLLTEQRLPATSRGAAIVAIGPATARALESAGLPPEQIAKESHSEGLAATLGSEANRRHRIVLVRPERSREELATALRAEGGQVVSLIVYRTVSSRDAPELARRIADGGFDAVVLPSPSSIDTLRAAGGEAVDRGLRSCALVAIGPTTAAHIESVGLGAAAVARSPTPEAIVDAVLLAVGEPASG